MFFLIISIVIGAAQLFIDNSEVEPSVKSTYNYECDSLNQLLIEYEIENGRYRIIMDRLYEEDSLLYNKITSNIE